MASGKQVGGNFKGIDITEILKENTAKIIKEMEKMAKSLSGIDQKLDKTAKQAKNTGESFEQMCKSAKESVNKESSKLD